VKFGRKLIFTPRIKLAKQLIEGASRRIAVPQKQATGAIKLPPGPAVFSELAIDVVRFPVIYV
jgi:hypothetical protein